MSMPGRCMGAADLTEVNSILQSAGSPEPRVILDLFEAVGATVIPLKKINRNHFDLA